MVLCLQSLLAIEFGASQVEPHTVEDVSSGSKLAIIIPGDQVESSSEDIWIGRVYSDREIAFQDALPVGGLVAVVTAIPEKHAPSIKIERLLLR